MAVKTEFDKTDFSYILRNYDIGEFDSCCPISEGAVQTNYILHTTDMKVVFRYYENRSYESVLFELSLLTFLKNNQYPCPTVYSHKDKLQTYKGKPYAIFEFMEGQHIINPSKQQFSELIKHIAWLNVLTENFVSEYTGYRLNYTIPTCTKLASKAVEEIGDTNAKEKFHWYADQIGKLVLPCELPMGVCHSDFHFSNVLYQGNILSSLLDFDDANYTYLLYDLACLISPFKQDFEWDTWQNFSPEDDVFDFAKACKIVSEYNQYRQLSETEKTYFFDIFKLTVFVDCLWYFQRGTSDDFYEKRKIEYLDRLGRNEFYRKLFCS